MIQSFFKNPQTIYFLTFTFLNSKIFIVKHKE